MIAGIKNATRHIREDIDMFRSNNSEWTIEQFIRRIEDRIGEIEDNTQMLEMHLNGDFNFMYED